MRKRKKKTSKTLTALLIVVAAVAVIAFLLIHSLDRIVIAAIETYGSEATGTTVTVSSVKIRLMAGEVSIRELVVGNPEGFSDHNAIRLENIAIAASPRKLVGDAVIIDKILIREPRVLYEINQRGESNIEQLRKNIVEARDISESGDASEKKIIIRSLVIEEGKVITRIGSLTEKHFSAAIPRIELTNLGGKGGTSRADIARQIVGALAREASVAVPAANAGKSLDKTFQMLLEKL